MAVTRRVINPKKLRPYNQPRKVRRSLFPSAPDSAATGYLVAGVVWLAMATGIGALWGLLRLFPELVAVGFEIPILPIGSTLGVEVTAATATDGFWNALVYGWLGNALIGAALFATPRVLGRPLAMPRLAFLSVVCWNLAALGGLAAVYAPALAAPGFLFEFPGPIDGLLALGLLIATASVVRTVLNPPAGVPYVAVAFFAVGLLAALGAVSIGGAIDAAAIFLDFDPRWQALGYGIAGRLLLGLGMGGMVLGTLFYAVPRVTGNSLWSSALAWLTWVLWLAFGSLSLLGALVDPVIPILITRAGEAATIMLLAPILLAVANLLLTVSGRWVLLLSPGALAFAVIGIAFVAASGLFDAIGALADVRAVAGRTDWIAGVLLYGLAGGAGCAALAISDHALPRLLRRDWGDTILVDVALYALFAGVTLAGVLLMIGGLVEGGLLARGAPPEEIEATLRWYRMVAAGGLGLAALGGLAALVNLFLMYTAGHPAEYVIQSQPTPAEPMPGETMPGTAVVARSS